MNDDILIKETHNTYDEFKIGDRVDIEDYPPYKYRNCGDPFYWPGTRWAVIVGIDSCDLDYYGGAFVWIATKGNQKGELGYVTCHDLYKEGQLYERKENE